jgi:hypothetical protein
MFKFSMAYLVSEKFRGLGPVSFPRKSLKSSIPGIADSYILGEYLTGFYTSLIIYMKKFLKISD